MMKTILSKVKKCDKELKRVFPKKFSVEPIGAWHRNVDAIPYIPPIAHVVYIFANFSSFQN